MGEIVHKKTIEKDEEGNWVSREVEIKDKSDFKAPSFISLSKKHGKRGIIGGEF